MKKFQKFLSAGLILAQVCSSSLALNDDSTARYVSLALDNIPRGNQVVLIKTQREPKKFSIANTFFTLAGLALGAEANLQLLCAKYPGVQLAFAGCADTADFKFSDYVKPHARLREITSALDMGINPLGYVESTLICQEIKGGWKQAAAIAALGSAKDIYVQHNGGTKFTFYYMPGNYGLTPVDACDYLQYLIQKANDLPENDDSPSEKKTTLIKTLTARQDLLKSCVSYKVWLKTYTTAANAGGFVVNTVKHNISRAYEIVTQYGHSPNTPKRKPTDPDGSSGHESAEQKNNDPSNQNEDDLQNTLLWPNSPQTSRRRHPNRAAADLWGSGSNPRFAPGSIFADQDYFGSLAG